jgi:hypothetical protein
MKEVAKTSFLEVTEGILKNLRDARNKIKDLSDQIADKELEAAQVNDQLNLARAQAFVKAATDVSKVSGKLINPNIDSQKAACEIILKKVDGYEDALLAHREMLTSIQKMKNEITCQHERRGDLKSKIQLLQLIATED